MGWQNLTRQKEEKVIAKVAKENKKRKVKEIFYRCKVTCGWPK